MLHKYGNLEMFALFYMKRLDQGHLHPKLEAPRLTCLGRDWNPGLYGARRGL
jgi:hypothetical protein